MADETDDPDIAASRLEAALERIARLAAMPPVIEPDLEPPEPATVSADTAELADRLDSLIDRLRGALSGKAG
jgi:hypothetical protein